MSASKNCLAVSRDKKIRPRAILKSPREHIPFAGASHGGEASSYVYTSAAADR